MKEAKAQTTPPPAAPPSAAPPPAAPTPPGNAAPPETSSFNCARCGPVTGFRAAEGWICSNCRAVLSRAPSPMPPALAEADLPEGFTGPPKARPPGWNLENVRVMSIGQGARTELALDFSADNSVNPLTVARQLLADLPQRTDAAQAQDATGPPLLAAQQRLADIDREKQRLAAIIQRVRADEPTADAARLDELRREERDATDAIAQQDRLRVGAAASAAAASAANQEARRAIRAKVLQDRLAEVAARQREVRGQIVAAVGPLVAELAAASHLVNELTALAFMDGQAAVAAALAAHAQAQAIPAPEMPPVPQGWLGAGAASVPPGAQPLPGFAHGLARKPAIHEAIDRYHATAPEVPTP
jgi:hypothetical protein